MYRLPLTSLSLVLAFVVCTEAKGPTSIPLDPNPFSVRPPHRHAGIVTVPPLVFAVGGYDNTDAATADVYYLNMTAPGTSWVPYGVSLPEAMAGPSFAVSNTTAITVCAGASSSRQSSVSQLCHCIVPLTSHGTSWNVGASWSSFPSPLAFDAATNAALSLWRRSDGETLAVLVGGSAATGSSVPLSLMPLDGRFSATTIVLTVTSGNALGSMTNTSICVDVSGTIGTVIIFTAVANVNNTGSTITMSSFSIDAANKSAAHSYSTTLATAQDLGLFQIADLWEGGVCLALATGSTMQVTGAMTASPVQDLFDLTYDGIGFAFLDEVIPWVGGLLRLPHDGTAAVTYVNIFVNSTSTIGLIHAQHGYAATLAGNGGYALFTRPGVNPTRVVVSFDIRTFQYAFFEHASCSGTLFGEGIPSAPSNAFLCYSPGLRIFPPSASSVPAATSLACLRAGAYLVQQKCFPYAASVRPALFANVLPFPLQTAAASRTRSHLLNATISVYVTTTMSRAHVASMTVSRMIAPTSTATLALTTTRTAKRHSSVTVSLLRTSTLASTLTPTRMPHMSPTPTTVSTTLSLPITATVSSSPQLTPTSYVSQSYTTTVTLLSSPSHSRSLLRDTYSQMATRTSSTTITRWRSTVSQTGTTTRTPVATQSRTRSTSIKDLPIDTQGEEPALLSPASKLLLVGGGTLTVLIIAVAVMMLRKQAQHSFRKARVPTVSYGISGDYLDLPLREDDRHISQI